MALDEGIESVPMMFGKERARQLDGAQHAGVEVAPQARKRRLDEAEVEARVVGDEDAVGQQTLDARSASKRGASATISLLIPVTRWISGGMGMSGSTRLSQRSTSTPSSTRRMAISVIRSRTG